MILFKSYLFPHALFLLATLNKSPSQFYQLHASPFCDKLSPVIVACMHVGVRTFCWSVGNILGATSP